MNVKDLRKEIDRLVFVVEKEGDFKGDDTMSVEHLNSLSEKRRVYALVRTKLQEAELWLGKVIEVDEVQK